MKIAKIIQVMLLPLMLAACGLTHHPYDRSNPKHWGNYKCEATGGGKTFTGWSVLEANAKSNALAICREKTGSRCELGACRNTERL